MNASPKGARFAPFNPSESEGAKGAEVAPLSESKGATRFVKGCNNCCTRIIINHQRTIKGTIRERAGRASPARGTRLSADWVLPSAWAEWARRECPDWTRERIQRVAEQFRDYWLAKAGADACKADWQATWRNWVRRETSFGEAAFTRNLGTGPPNRQAALDAENARAKAMLFGPEPEVIDV